MSHFILEGLAAMGGACLGVWLAETIRASWGRRDLERFLRQEAAGAMPLRQSPLTRCQQDEQEIDEES